MRLGITAIVKNEARYIAEWLCFYKLQGVDKFFIYDNGSTDNLKEVLQKYWDFNITYEPWPGECLQLAAYNHSIKNNIGKVDWMAFLDIDEFLFSPTGETVNETLWPFDSNDGTGIVAVQWWLFGSNGRRTYDPGLVIDRFTAKAPEPDKHCKSIVRMNSVIKTGWESHSFVAYGEVVDENFNVLEGPYAIGENRTADTLRINHYHVKSAEEYKEKCAKGRADIAKRRVFETDFPAHDRNEVEDFYLVDTYASKIKEMLR